MFLVIVDGSINDLIVGNLEIYRKSFNFVIVFIY